MDRNETHASRIVAVRERFGAGDVIAATMSNFIAPRRLRRIDAEERRNLHTGMRKLYDPIRDDSFEDLLHAISRGGR